MSRKVEIKWSAAVYYRTELGDLDVTHDLEEIQDLHNLIEAGPHFDTIARVEITRVNAFIPDMKVEQDL